ncbi:hypothetical protein BDZ97DRAFT_875017 [Flammula alnicola]|nr:hypothetical protein BDZ97DRAFT_875017 [Flammula alnicola]
MLSPYVIATLALVPFAAAQSLDIEAIEAHFTQSALVPDLFTSFDPSALLSLNFAVGDLKPGQLLTQGRCTCTYSHCYASELLCIFDRQLYTGNGRC